MPAAGCHLGLLCVSAAFAFIWIAVAEFDGYVLDCCCTSLRSYRSSPSARWSRPGRAVGERFSRRAEPDLVAYMCYISVAALIAAGRNWSSCGDGLRCGSKASPSPLRGLTWGSGFEPFAQRFRIKRRREVLWGVRGFRMCTAVLRGPRGSDLLCGMTVFSWEAN